MQAKCGCCSAHLYHLCAAILWFQGNSHPRRAFLSFGAFIPLTSGTSGENNIPSFLCWKRDGKVSHLLYQHGEQNSKWMKKQWKWSAAVRWRMSLKSDQKCQSFLLSCLSRCSNCCVPGNVPAFSSEKQVRGTQGMEGLKLLTYDGKWKQHRSTSD